MEARARFGFRKTRMEMCNIIYSLKSLNGDNGTWKKTKTKSEQDTNSIIRGQAEGDKRIGVDRRQKKTKIIKNTNTGYTNNIVGSLLRDSVLRENQDMGDESQKFQNIEKDSFCDNYLVSRWARSWKGECQFYSKQSAQSGGADAHEDDQCSFIALLWLAEDPRTNPEGKTVTSICRCVICFLCGANFCTHRPVNKDRWPQTRINNAKFEYTSKIWRQWIMARGGNHVSAGKNQSLTNDTLFCCVSNTARILGHATHLASWG